MALDSPYHINGGVQGHNSVRILNKGRYVTGPWTTWRCDCDIPWIYQFPKKFGGSSRNGIYIYIHAVLKKIWPFSWAKKMRSRHVSSGLTGSLFDVGG